MTDQDRRLSQGLKISTEPDSAGFDLSAGSKWIYPENYPIREYQFTIVQTALYNNTLVCLPTGLGKTFIAAVVMYNFWRWYPKGKVVFLAPTKPLVAQQIDACHGIMGIPSEETIELTGTVNQVKRQTAWLQKRVIFATPQTFQNDLQKEIVPCELIKCVVFDEAHKALGRHSYCEIIKLINMKNKFFRVLALSATPGSKIDHVREVIQNLQISQLELRDDSSPDITPYSNEREIETIVVGLNPELAKFKERYILVMDPHVKSLIQNNILRGDTANISRGRIFLLMNEFRARPGKAANHGHIMMTFNILVSMYHAYELLIRNGPRSFLKFFQNHSDKWWIERDTGLKNLLNDIESYVGYFPVVMPMPDGSIPEIPDDLVFGHNKFTKLQELLLRHFKSFEAESRSTRSIVFVEYRDTVNEVYVLLLKSRPLIRPQIFVGQAGLKQKQQMKALDDFRNNKVNVLISTSVGEEGLDVGEVDLIICFDISSSAPTRLVQRMGRTGRKRNGNVIVLVTEGKEMQTFKSAMSRKDSLNKKVLESSNILSSMYPESPRMIPKELEPVCYKMFIKAQLKTQEKPKKAAVERKKKKKADDKPLDSDFVQPTTSKTVSKKQPSLMSFFTEKKLTQSSSQCRSNENTQSQVFVKPSNVKLLSSNSDGFEFLTLCTLKNSEKEMEEQKVKVDLTYVPTVVDNDDDIFSTFTVPMMDVLNCLSTLSEEPEKSKNAEDVTMYENDLSMDCRDSQIFPKSFKPEMLQSKYRSADVVPASPAIVEAHFEDLLDEFSESDTNSEIGKSKVGNEDIFEDLLNDSEEDCIEDTTVMSNNQTVIPEISSVINDVTCSEDSCTIIEDDIKKANTEITSEMENGDFDTLDSLNDVTVIEPPKRSECSKEPVTNTGNGIYDEDENAWDISSFFRGLQKGSKKSSESEPVNMCNLEKDKPTSNCIEEEDSNHFEENLSGISALREQLTCEKSKDSKIECFSEQNSTETPIVVNRIEMVNVGMEYSMDVSDMFCDLDQKTNDSRSNNDLNKSNSKENEENFIDSEEDLFESFEKDMVSSIINAQPNPEQQLGNDVDDAKSDETFFESDPEITEVPKNPVEVGNSCQNEPKSSTSKTIDQDVVDLIFDNWDSDFADSPKATTSTENYIEPRSSTDWIPVDTKNDSGRSSLKRKISDLTSPVRKKSYLEDVVNHVKVQPPQYNCFFMQNSQSNRKVFEKQNTKRCLSLLASKQNFEQKTTNSKPERKGFEAIKNNAEKHDQKIVIVKDDSFTDFVMPQKPKFKLQQTKTLNNLQSPVRTHLSLSEKLRLSENKENENWISTVVKSERSQNKSEINSKKVNKKKKRKKKRNEFIAEEAEVSTDAETSEGSSGGEEYDEDLEDFVSYTQNVTDEVDMRAHYLQALKSPRQRPGAFQFREVKEVPPEEIYSQFVSQEDNTYLHDSFCVDGTDDEKSDSERLADETVLGQLEFILENKKRNKKPKRLEFEVLRKKREKMLEKKNVRRRTVSDDSSEDEAELLRKQVLEESILLRKSKPG